MGWLPVPNPVAFSLFGVDVMWYGVLIAFAVILCCIIAYFRAPKFGLVSEDFIDIFLCGAPAGIIGARAYYVAFSWDTYKNNLSEILNFRGGGLAIHGAILGAALGIFIYCKAKKQPILRWADLMAPLWPLAQAIGRWGNYFNSEAHGTATTLPWAIYCDGEWVHPTFLYESIWCLLVCIFLFVFQKKGGYKFRGQLICLYACLYSVERFFVEGLRTDSLMIGSLRQAQLISIGAFALGLAGLFVFKKLYPIEKESGEDLETVSC